MYGPYFPLKSQNQRGILIFVRPADPCPEDLEARAEAYLLGTLPEREAALFEDHYLTCARCTAVLEESDRYISAFRSAAREARGGESATAAAGK